MKKIYNKGKFRSGERAKHLRPYLKRVANKRWRKTSKNIALEEFVNIKKRKSPLKKDFIKVKITTLNYGSAFSYTKKYRNLRDLHNAIKRNSVLKFIILSN